MSKKDKTVSGIILSIILLLVFVGIYRLNIFKNQIVLKVGIHSGDYWDNPNGNYYETLDFAIEKFEAAHENVKVEYVSGIGADDYSEWLSEQIVKGEEPDVFLVLPEDFSLFAPAGILADLDQMIWDDASYSRKNFYSPCIKAGTYNDTQYALPYESVPTVMFVNKTLLAEKGIPFPDSNWSWEDFYEICKQVTDLEEHEYGVYDYSWLDAMYTNGMTLFSEDGKTCNLSKEKVKEAIQFVIDLEALNEGYTVSSKDFDLGKVAFHPFLYSEYRAYQPYPWRVKKYTDFEWEGITMPAGPFGDNVSELHTMLLGISSRTTHKDLAWELIRMLSGDEEIQKNLCMNSSGISPLISVAEDPEMVSMIQENIPGGSSFEGNIIHEIMSTAVYTPHFPKYSQALRMAEETVAEQIRLGNVSSGTLIISTREINQLLEKK